MKIGIFDSGLGGLAIVRSIVDLLPQYDYHYLGDTLHVPYGNRSQESIYQLTKQNVEYLFKQDCKLVILACNTASAKALRRLQQEYLPTHYPDRRILGVIIPTLERVLELDTNLIGLLATRATVNSNVYKTELQKLKPTITIKQVAAPLLVPLIENRGEPWLESVLHSYLKEFGRELPEAIILGCTHYAVAKDLIREIVDHGRTVISQDEVVAESLEKYLRNHPEIESVLTRNSEYTYEVTDFSQDFDQMAAEIFGRKLDIHQTHVHFED